MNARKYLPNYTYQDYEQWKGKWELIDGIPYAMSPAPSIKHQRISTELLICINEELKHCSSCRISMPIDWKINQRTVVQPDLLIICHETEGQYLTKAPELIIEILSPSTAHKDRNLKYELYEEQQVKYYLIVDPVTDSIEIYGLADKKYQLLGKIDPSNTHFDFSLDDCRFSVDFSKIW